MKENSPKLAVVVPCYNEEEALPYTIEALGKKLAQLTVSKIVDPASTVCFVDDGSSDNTWQILKEKASELNWISAIKLSRNCGHQRALTAGLLSVDADIVISIDADLQDDLNAFDAMIQEYLTGADIVYGVRSDRSTDTFFKRVTAQAFYKLMSALGTATIYNHADFRLMSRRSLRAFEHFKERNLFLRGLVPMLGFRTSKVFYSRNQRVAGETKYPFKKMVALAWEGVSSTSTVPLRWVTFLGLLMATISLFLGLFSFIIRLFADITVPGWASTVLPIYFLGGTQLFAMGILGEYLGKVYLEVKGRPRFIIADQLGDVRTENVEFD